MGISKFRAVFVAAALAFAGLIGCKSGPETREEPAEEGAEASTDERDDDSLPMTEDLEAVEQQFQGYRREQVVPAEIMADLDYDGFQARLQEKTDRMGALEGEYAEMHESSDPVEVTASYYRVGQMYLNYGCETRRLMFPGPSDRRRRMERLFRRQAETLVQKARKSLEASSNGGATPWSERAAETLEAWNGGEAGVEDVCRKTEEVWNWGGDVEMAQMRSACGGEDADKETCLRLAKLLTGDEASTYRKRACGAGATEACIEVAEKVHNAEDWEEGHEFYRKACDGERELGCTALKALVVPSKADSYAEDCEAGDPGACFKRASILAAEDDSLTVPYARQNLLDQCKPGEIAESISEKEAARRCREGDAFACVTRAAYLIGVGDGEYFGNLLEVGRGEPDSEEIEVEDDPDPAELDESCRRGNTVDCLRLAKYRENNGDSPVAAWRKACSAASRKGCWKYGRHQLRNGEAEKGLELLRTHCKGDYRPACRTVARAFLNGKHLPKSPGCAASHLWLNCSSYDVEGCPDIDPVLGEFGGSSE